MTDSGEGLALEAEAAGLGIISYMQTQQQMASGEGLSWDGRLHLSEDLQPYQPLSYNSHSLSMDLRPIHSTAGRTSTDLQDGEAIGAMAMQPAADVLGGVSIGSILSYSSLNSMR